MVLNSGTANIAVIIRGYRQIVVSVPIFYCTTLQSKILNE